jgi:hypothetical protein
MNRPSSHQLRALLGITSLLLLVVVVVVGTVSITMNLQSTLQHHVLVTKIGTPTTHICCVCVFKL